MTIINLDAPVIDAEEEADEFMVKFNLELGRTCKQDVLCLVGEWNTMGLYA